jgi:hypothetical protein
MGGKSPLPSVTPGSAQLFGCLMNPIPGYYRTLVATTVFEVRYVPNYNSSLLTTKQDCDCLHDYLESRHADARL